MASPSFKSAVYRIPIINSHEHIGVEHGIIEDGRQRPESDRERGLFDILFSGYLWNILGCAGVDVAQVKGGVTEEEQWRRVKPVLPLIVNTGTYRAHFRAFRDLFGFRGHDLTDRNWQGLSKRIRKVHATRDKREWYREVMRRCGVERSLRIVSMKYYKEMLPGLPPKHRAIEEELFVPIMQMDCFLYGWRKDAKNGYVSQQRNFAEMLGHEPRGFDGFVALIEKAFGLLKEKRVPGIKFHSSYLRTLGFENVPLADVKPLYARPEGRLAPADRKRFEDAIMHLLVRLAGEHGMAVQYHTGLGNLDVPLTNPGLLQNLFSAHRSTKFVLFHAGYPHVGEWIVKGLRNPNVYLDLCWIPLLSPALFRRILDEAVELLQANKLIVGGDVACVEHAYGTMMETRDALAEVLADKVKRGYLSRAQALDLAGRILHRNAREIYGL